MNKLILIAALSAMAVACGGEKPAVDPSSATTPTSTEAPAAETPATPATPSSAAPAEGAPAEGAPATPEAPKK